MTSSQIDGSKNCVLKGIGFWREGWSDLVLPHPAELRFEGWANREKKSLVEYLNSGLLLNCQLGCSWNRFEPGSRGESMGSCERTDGVWLWPEGLSIYLSRYNVRLPPAFREHARAKRYACPQGLDAGTLEYTEVSLAEWVEWSTHARSNRFLALASVVAQWFVKRLPQQSCDRGPGPQ